MKQGIYTVAENRRIAQGVYKLVLTGDKPGFTAPGQFLNIKLDGFFLRRPISICDWDEGSATVIYKILGAGTESMTRLATGTALDVLTGLGNGFDTSQSGDRPLLIGGGVGVPPMYKLCKALLEQGKRPAVVLGFNGAGDVFYDSEFAALGADVTIYTADGSVGQKGLVTDGVAAYPDHTFFYACGPTAMLKALEKAVKTDGQYSFEERMGCGFGACMGCTMQTKNGPKRVCKDGPVFGREEILW